MSNSRIIEFLKGAALSAVIVGGIAFQLWEDVIYKVHELNWNWINSDQVEVSVVVEKFKGEYRGLFSFIDGQEVNWKDPDGPKGDREPGIFEVNVIIDVPPNSDSLILMTTHFLPDTNETVTLELANIKLAVN